MIVFSSSVVFQPAYACLHLELIIRLIFVKSTWLLPSTLKIMGLEQHLLKATKLSPNSKLPLLHHNGVFINKSASDIELVFERNGWTPAWRYSMYKQACVSADPVYGHDCLTRSSPIYSHYHSISIYLEISARRTTDDG